MSKQPPPSLAELQAKREVQVANCAELCTPDHPKIMHVMYCRCGKKECMKKMKDTILAVLPKYPIDFTIKEQDMGTEGYNIFVTMNYNDAVKKP